MIDAIVDVKRTFYNFIPTLPGLVHSPVLLQNECTRGWNLQTAFTLFTKGVIRPELTVCLKRCFVPLYVFKAREKGKTYPVLFRLLRRAYLQGQKTYRTVFARPERIHIASFLSFYFLKTEDSFTRASNTFLDKPYLSWIGWNTFETLHDTDFTKTSYKTFSRQNQKVLSIIILTAHSLLP